MSQQTRANGDEGHDEHDENDLFEAEHLSLQQNGDAHSDDQDMSGAEEPAMDETEEELERLVFGDEAGFRNELHQFNTSDSADRAPSEEGNALAGIQDADLFFLDDGPGHAGDEDMSSGEDEDDDGDDAVNGRGSKLAWEDSDDERILISLMAVPRLRKLRNFEGEDVISGKEYARRLRRQYLALQPMPQWAKWDAEVPPKKRRRHSTNGRTSDNDDEDEQSASDMDVAAGNGVGDDDDDNDDDEEYSAQPLAKLLRSSQTLTRSSQAVSNKRVRLRSEVIAVERMKDISPAQPHAITCLAVHPALPIILSAGLSSMLYLHHLKPRPTVPDPANPLITSLHLKRTPLTTAAFSPRPTTDAVSSTDPKIYLSSRRRYFHTWTLPTGQITKTTRVIGQQETTQRSFETLKPSPCGRYLALLGTTRKRGGVVNVLDATTTQWIAQARIESRKGVADFAWWGDGRGLCIAGRDGEVSEWSVDERKILHRWRDEGQVGATVISLGGKLPGVARRRKGAPTEPPLGPDRYVTTGSTSGVVNIYDRSTWLDDAGMLASPPENPTPLRTLSNLVTPISHVVFSPCGQVMAMSSRWKRDALRLVHLPSCTVYRNWPTSKTPLGRISALALGEWTDYAEASPAEPDGRRRLVLLVGNEQGVLRGWELTG